MVTSDCLNLLGRVIRKRLMSSLAALTFECYATIMVTLRSHNSKLGIAFIATTDQPASLSLPYKFSSCDYFKQFILRTIIFEIADVKMWKFVIDESQISPQQWDVWRVKYTELLLEFKILLILCSYFRIYILRSINFKVTVKYLIYMQESASPLQVQFATSVGSPRAESRVSTIQLMP